MDVKINECPFCGADGRLVHNTKAGLSGSVIECSACGSKGKWFAISTNYSSDVKAVEAWNNRV